MLEINTGMKIEAKRDIVVCDGGQHGSTMCSNCGHNVENHFDSCPNCNASFLTPDNVHTGFGGSDFP